jgi:PAS domain S-box-containing protein
VQPDHPLVEIVAEIDPARRLERILTAALAGTAAAGVALTRVELSAGIVTMQAGLGTPPPPASVAATDALKRCVVEVRRPVRHTPGEADGASFAGSWVGAPVSTEAGVIGVLSAYRDAAEPFTAEDETFLLVLAGLAGGALREQAARARLRAVGHLLPPAETLTSGSAGDAGALDAPDGRLAIVEGIEDGLMIFDADDRLMLWNQRLLTLAPSLMPAMRPGISFAALVRACAERGYYHDIPGDVDEIVAHRLGPEFGTGAPYELCVDDRRLLAKEIRTDDGGRLLVMTDVTDLRRTDAALQISEQHYRLLVDGVDDIIYQTDGRGVFTYLNPRVATILGWPAEQLVGKPYTHLILPEARPAARRFYVQQFARRIPSTYYEFPAWSADGRVVWVGQQVRVLERDGQVIGSIGVARDITARKQAEEDEHTRRQIVEGIARNAPLNDILEQLAALFERRAPDWRCAILVSRPPRLQVGAAPHWPTQLLGVLADCMGETDADANLMACGYDLDHCLSWALTEAKLTGWSGYATTIRGADEAVVGFWGIIAPGEGDGQEPADVQAILPELVHLAAVAIEHARLTERLEIRATRARTLNKLGQMISASLDLKTVLAEIARAAVTLLGAPIGRFWMVDEADESIWLAADISEIPGLTHGPTRRPIAELRGILGTVVRERTLAVIADAATDPRVVDANWWSTFGLRSFLGQPVMLDGKLLAVLVLWGRQPFLLDDEDTALLDSFVAHAAVSIRNAQLYQATDQQRQHLQSQVEVSRRLSRGLDLTEVLDAITEAAATTFGGEAGVRLFDGDELVRASVSRGARQRPSMQRISTVGGLIADVLRTGRPASTSDVTTDARIPTEYHEHLQQNPMTAVLISPVRHEGRVLGTLHIYRERGYVWGQDALNLAESLADQAATALANATRYASLQESLERARIPARVNRLLSEALDLEDLLREIATAAVKITGAVVSTVWLSDEASKTLTIAAFSDEGLGKEQQFRRATHGEGAAGWVAQHRTVLHVDDIFADGRTGGLAWWRTHGLSSSYTVPIFDGAAVVGVLSINGRDPIRLNDDTRDLLSGLLAQSAAAIRNAALYREVAVTNRRLEQEVRRNELLLNSVADGVFGVDDHGRLTFINPAATRMLGYDASDVLGQDAHDRLHHASPDGVGSCPAAVALRQGQEYRSSDDGLWRRDGRRVPVDLVVTPLQQDGNTLGAVVTFRDLSRQQEAERQRRALAQNEKLRALGQLASGVAHDLNQSLGLVVGHSELALETAGQAASLPPALRESLETIMQGALDGAQTVKRLQTFVRGQPDGDPERVAVTALLTDVVRLTAPRWRDAAQAVGAPVSVSVNVSLNGDDEILGWPASLREALINLVFNAIDALPRGGSLQLVARDADEQVIIEIVDSGTGMTPEVAARIFEPFYTTKGERGTGLGLAMVYGIVERHGGRIEIDSAPGRGTTVRLILPRAPRHAVHRPTARPEEAPRKRTILIVDDEAALRRMMTQMLQLDGHTVAAAASATEAVAMLEEQRFDVVLSDHGLGLGMNGLELATLVKERWPGTRFILVTGWGGSIDPAEVASLGVEAVISKPYRAPELRQRINALP